MTVDQMKKKAERKQAELKDLQKKIKDEEQAKKKAEEMLKKLEAIMPEVAKGINAMFEKTGIELSEGNQIIISADENELIAHLITKPVRVGRGNGGVKAIMFEGQNISWSKLCTLKNIATTAGGSAHRDVFNKARELHDSIEHTCIIDGKVYPHE